MDLREESARFFFMERKKAPDAPCAGQRDSPDDSPHRRVDFFSQWMRDRPLIHCARRAARHAAHRRARPTPPAVPLRNRDDAHRRSSSRTELLFATVSSRSALPRSALRIAGKAGVRAESGSVGALLIYVRPTPSRSQSDAHRLCAGTVLLFATVSSRSPLPRSGLRIAGKAGVRAESGSVGALLIYGQRRPEAKVTRIVSAPKQACSSRRFQAETHSPVPLCASPEKQVSAQEAAPSARSL